MQIRKLHAPRIIHDTVQEEKDIELSSYKSLDEVIRPRLSLSLCYGLHVTEFCYFVFLLSHTLNFPFHLISWGGFTDPQLYWRLFEFACRLGISNIHISVPRCSCWLSRGKWECDFCLVACRRASDLTQSTGDFCSVCGPSPLPPGVWNRYLFSRRGVFHSEGAGEAPGTETSLKSKYRQSLIQRCY